MQIVKLFTKDACPYCDAAKRLLKKLAISFEEKNLENDAAERQRLSVLAGGYRTMPMIWIGETFVGGYSELDALNQRGELLPKIQR
ncbi:MAG: glutaredoxin [Proteobacteria bacterium]|nr:glutaredoxin [Pseudomonadota bacterium]